MQKLKQYRFDYNILGNPKLEEVATPTQNSSKVKLVPTTPVDTKIDELLEADANHVPLFRSNRSTIKTLGKPSVNEFQNKDHENGNKLDSLLTKIDQLDK